MTIKQFHRVAIHVILPVLAFWPGFAAMPAAAEKTANTVQTLEKETSGKRALQELSADAGGHNGPAPQHPDFTDKTQENAPPGTQPLENQTENALQAESDEQWVRLESGARPAYVGIQGGTAPVSLLRATNGSLFVFTGNTGNDFTQVLSTDGSRNGTLLSPGAEQVAMASAAHSDLQPFGLSNPKDMRSTGKIQPDKAYDNAGDFKPLRLKSYKQVLEYSGGL